MKLVVVSLLTLALFCYLPARSDAEPIGPYCFNAGLTVPVIYELYFDAVDDGIFALTGRRLTGLGPSPLTGTGYVRGGTTFDFGLYVFLPNGVFTSLYGEISIATLTGTGTCYQPPFPGGSGCADHTFSLVACP